jgi:dTMP kinase
MHGVLPHLTLILMIKPEIGLARINANANREVNRMDKEKLVMHQQVYKAYSSIIKDDKTNRIKSIDASKSIEKVFNECYRNVRTKIK